MKSSFYIKLFGAFTLFILILLFLINIAFNSFYSMYSNKIEVKKIEYILDTQALKFEDYIKNYSDKLLLIEPILSKMNNQNEIKSFVNDSLFKDLNILTFRVVDFDSKEILKLVNRTGSGQFLPYGPHTSNTVANPGLRSVSLTIASTYISSLSPL